NAEKTCDRRVVIKTVRRSERADAPRVYIKQKPVIPRAVSQQRIAAGAVCRRRVKDVCVAVEFVISTTVSRRLRDEINNAAVYVGTVLRAVWSTQDLDCLESRGLDQTEERADTAALRTRRVTNAVDVDRNVSSSQATHKYCAQRRARALQAYACLFVDNLGHDF